MKISGMISVVLILMTVACATQKDVVSLDSRLGEIELREAQLKRDKEAFEAARPRASRRCVSKRPPCAHPSMKCAKIFAV